MKKILLGIVMALSVVMFFPIGASARTPQDDSLVKELSGGLPVYMGNGLTWNTFDIDKEGYLVIGLISNNLPELSKMDESLRTKYQELLVGPQSGYVGLSKHLGRKMKINLYNTNNELCVTEIITPETPQSLPNVE